MARPMEDANLYGTRERRLPTLNEVLNRQSRPPVDLFSFYIYMRDQQRSVDYLDFWLDVSQHMSLCRHFVREMRRSVLLETPEFEKMSKRSSRILDQYESGNGSNGYSNGNTNRNGNGHYRSDSVRSDMSQDQRVSQILREQPGKHSHNGSDENSKGNTPPADAGRPSFMSSLPGDSSSQNDSPPQTVTRADIRASAEKILYTFLLSGSEREIILPAVILRDITEAIEEHGRDDPEVFDAAKEYVFQAMERDAYPGFLRAKAFGNLVPPSLMLRLILGLLAIFGAFWAAFILVFTARSRTTRCWLILPFSIGVYSLVSHQYTIDPFLALAGYSEYTFLSFTKVQEPFVRKLLMQRGFAALAATILITAAVCSLFIFVPSTHL